MEENQENRLFSTSMKLFDTVKASFFIMGFMSSKKRVILYKVCEKRRTGDSEVLVRGGTLSIKT